MQRQDCSRSIPIKGYKYDGEQTRMLASGIRKREAKKSSSLRKQSKLKKVPCPCCRNGRLLDVEEEKQRGYTEVDIKCPICRNLIKITITDTEIRTEQIGA